MVNIILSLNSVLIYSTIRVRIMKLNKKQQRTLRRVFETPTPHLSVAWRDIESLLKSCGARIMEGDGSAIRIVLNGRKVFMHRPHPHKEAKGYQVKAIRELLESAGIRP